MDIAQGTTRFFNKVRRKTSRILFYMKNCASSKPGEVQKFDDYDAYVAKQLTKTNNPDKIAIWTDPEYYKQKTQKFTNILNKNAEIIKNAKKALSVGSRVGNEVLAIKSFGPECIGIDLVPFKDLVIKGDMHDLAFEDGTFQFIFSNILDHSLYPDKFFSEVARVLSPGGHFILHVCIGIDLDEHSAINLLNVKQVKELAKDLKLVRVREFDKDDMASFTPINTEFLFKKVS